MMLVRKYQGKTEEEIREKYLKELGPEAIVLNIRYIQPKGLKKLFCSPKFEAIVAVENMEQKNPSVSSKIPADSTIQCILEQQEKIRQETETLENIKDLVENKSQAVK